MLFSHSVSHPHLSLVRSTDVLLQILFGRSIVSWNSREREKSVICFEMYREEIDSVVLYMYIDRMCDEREREMKEERRAERRIRFFFSIRV